MEGSLHSDPKNRWKFHGIFDQTVSFIEQQQLMKTALWKRFAEQFRFDADYDAGWRCEYWGKMMRGACFVYAYSRNPALYAVLTETVEDILTTQEENGRISSYAPQHEFDGWDLWGRKYVLLGLQYFLEICTDSALRERIIHSLCRQADHIIGSIGPAEEGKLPITKATRHWHGLNSSSILEPIVRLYRLTGERRYFDFAQYIVSCGGTDIADIFELAYRDQLYPCQYPVTKAYEMISCFEGLLEFYEVTGNERLRVAVINFANRILESDFTVIGNSGCTEELFDHSTVRQAKTPANPVMQETCVTVTLMKFFYRLHMLTGDAKFADAFEISFYNAYLGAVNTEQVINPMIPREHPDWIAEPLPFDSYSPLTAGVRGHLIGGIRVMRDKHYYGCCACIGAAGVGLVPKMAVLHGKSRLAISMYLDGTVQTATPSGQPLSLAVKTAYPIGDTVQITMELAQAEHFILQLRIPYWSETYHITVQGQPVLPTRSQNGFAEIERDWQDGDIVTLTLDMRTQLLRPPVSDSDTPTDKKHVALRRGPLMLAQENRLGYSVDEPIAPPVSTDGYAVVSFPEKDAAPFPHMLELEVALSDGTALRVTDYASAGKLWTEESKLAVWMLTDA